MGTVKYSGPVASFHCPTNAEIRSLKVHFSPKQEGSGDPSPENVRPIIGWDGLTMYRTGKNLFNVNRTEGSPNPTTISNSTSPRIMDCIHYFRGLQAENYYYKNYTIATVSNGTITVTNKNNNSYGIGFPVCVKSNTIYTLSFTAQNSLVSFGYYDNEWHYLSASTGNASENPRTITTPEKTCYMVIVFRAEGFETATYTYSNIQLELGSTATSYEPYQGSTTNYEFGVLGKNKLDKNSYTYLNSSLIYFGGDNSLEPDGSLFLKAGTYTFSVSTIANAIFASDANKQNIAFASNTNTATFTLPESIAVRIGCYVQGATNEELLAYNYQLELGSTATTYEPYDPNHTVYGGWVDLISGEVREEWKPFDLTTLTLTQFGIGQSVLTISAFPGAIKSRNAMYCNFLPPVSNPNISGVESVDWNNSRLNMCLSVNRDLDTQAKVEQWLADMKTDGTTPTIVADMVTSNTYYLAPTQLQTFLGHNNVWSNADYVEVEYDLHETQNILARKQFIVANQPHIVKPAAAPLQNFTTDVTAPLKECKIGFEPVQDLHGYSNPWPAGGGKNIAKPYDNNYVSSTYISFDYSAANGTFRCYGTASASSTHSSPSATNAANNGATFTLPAGTYTLSIIDGDGANIYTQCVSSDETVLAETTSYTTFTTNESLTVFVRLKVAAAATVDNTVKIQLEAGSTATSYVPYENICPISGWTGVNVKQTGKNLFDKEFLSDIQNYPISGAYSYNYTNSILLIPNTTYKLSPTSTNKLDTGNYYVLRTGEYNTGTIYYPVTAGKPMVITFTTSSTGKICFGTYLTSDALPLFMTVDWQLEIGSTATSYEPYTGTTIPISFPSVTNILNSTTITTNKTLSAAGEETSETGMSVTNYIKVNEGDTYKLTFTSKEGARTRRIWSYNASKEPIEYLASASWVTVDTVGSIQATVPSGVEYIRICYKTADEDIFLEGPESSIIYGGYVDLINGEVVQEWETVKIADLNWYNYNGKIHYYAMLPSRERNTYIYTDMLTPRATGAFTQETVGELTYYGEGTTATYKYIWTRVPEAMEATEANEWIKNTYADAIICYKLEIPIHYSLTSTQLKTLRGTNNLYSNSNGNIELAFWTH